MATAVVFAGDLIELERVDRAALERLANSIFIRRSSTFGGIGLSGPAVSQASFMIVSRESRSRLDDVSCSSATDWVGEAARPPEIGEQLASRPDKLEGVTVSWPRGKGQETSDATKG